MNFGINKEQIVEQAVDLRKIVMLFVFCISPIYFYGQILTQPLFMQIKTPKLESHSGESIDQTNQKYFISSYNKDSIDISFYISVPKEMLSEKWAISLAPSIFSAKENGILKEVVIKGWRFAEVQNADYQRYHEFVNSIIDSTMYEKMYIDQKRLEKEIEQRHDMYWQFYYDEWQRQVAYEKWKSTQDGSTQTYFVKDKESYRGQLYAQYLLRIENQSKRYLKAGMDTIGLHAKYMREFEVHDAKMPRYFVRNNSNLRKVPKKFKDIFESGRTLQDITDSMLDLLVKRDSALMSLPVLDYDKIIENEKKTMLQNGIYEDLIQLPKNENALLDTVIYDTRSDYRYLYTYRYSVRKNEADTIKVKLNTKILATDRSGYSTNSEDILIYVVAPKLDINQKLSKGKQDNNKTSTTDKLTNENSNIYPMKSRKDEEKEEEEEYRKKLTERLNQLGISSEKNNKEK